MNRSSALAGAIAVLIFAGCGPGESDSSAGESARVTRVIDGDTVVVERLGETRLIGVNTPEKCGDDAATRFTEERLLDKVVQVEIGEEPKDRYDRTLAYLSRDEKMHNLALLTEGYATGPDHPAERQVRLRVRGRRAAGSSCERGCAGDLRPQQAARRAPSPARRGQGKASGCDSPRARPRGPTRSSSCGASGAGSAASTRGACARAGVR